MHRKLELTEGYTWRRATNADADAVQEVVFTVLKEYGLPVDKGKTDMDLMAPADFYADGFFGVIENKERAIVGTFGLKEHEKGIAEIRKMYLLSSCRGKGIGHFMMRFLLFKAKELGYQTVMLETASVLREAIFMYEKYGFVLDENAPFTERCDKMYYLNL